MQSMNTCLFSGNLGADAELRTTRKGTAVLAFRLAVTESWFDETKNARGERVSWLDFVLFGPRAEGLAKYLTKGTRATVTAEAYVETWEDSHGQKRSAVKFRVNEIEWRTKQPHESAPTAPAADDFHRPEGM